MNTNPMQMHKITIFKDDMTQKIQKDSKSVTCCKSLAHKFCICNSLVSG